MAKFLKDKNTYANKFPTSMKKGGIKKYRPGGENPVKKPAIVAENSKSGPLPIDYINQVNKEGVPGSRQYQILQNQKNALTTKKKGGSINKTAGKTTTGVVSNYKGYKGPKVKAQVAKVKKSKGKL